MTFQSRGQTMSRTRVFLRRQLWIWPIIAVLLLLVIGLFVRNAIQSTMRASLASELQTLLNVETAMLETWFNTQLSNAAALANDLQVRETIYGMLDAQRTAPDDELIDKSHEELLRKLAPSMSSHHYVGYFLADKSKRIIASSHAALIGQQGVPEYDDFLSRALEGDANVCPPFPSVVIIKNKLGKVRVGEPTMFVCAPVRDANFQVIAALALQIRPEREFTRILQLGRLGNSGETYAFDRQGVMVSNSRFDEDLILLGILPDTEHARSILSIQVRDPQGDMTAGFRPLKRRAELPLTRMALSATTGNADIDVDGYRDYRGVPVVGAWRWMAAYDLGVTTEVDVAEAYRPLTILQYTFWILFGLLALSSVAIFFFTLVVSRLQREAQRAAIEAQQLGQYTLEEKLGAGGMGVVYRGRHAMLQRPTAIKMLDVDTVNDASIERFEREVKITCRLNHPSTIAIYDYGRTPEGVFYYAMEYLDGIDLQALVEDYGPQPEERVIHILLQICGSLYEAHSEGLVHRDIKPANIMLNRRGGLPDVVKVLDFGLVKALDDQKQVRATAAGAVTGTPLYMSPEAVNSPMSVDARSDIYAVGAVGYYLLTGEPVFKAPTLIELCQKHVDEAPLPPGERLGKDVSTPLENALMACLEKNRARRPQTARDLEMMLRDCPSVHAWTITQGDAWWNRHERGNKDDNTTDMSFSRTVDSQFPH